MTISSGQRRTRITLGENEARCRTPNDDVVSKDDASDRVQRVGRRGV